MTDKYIGADWANISIDDKLIIISVVSGSDIVMTEHPFIYSNGID